jgi:hypothetical protein
MSQGWERLFGSSCRAADHLRTEARPFKRATGAAARRAAGFAIERAVTSTCVGPVRRVKNWPVLGVEPIRSRRRTAVVASEACARLSYRSVHFEASAGQPERRRAVRHVVEPIGGLESSQLKYMPVTTPICPDEVGR